ncbi:hypothetical protein F4777DRAFT_30911 [Nemania sp. FL0916]|nr:hypothetical protein F4777DRAFT_30911 [Nemania sp. FL0916]
MGSYYRDRYHSHHHKDGYDLAHHLIRDLRHSHRPTQYIINEGKLTVDAQTFENFNHSSGHKSNTIIYNSPGSELRIDNRRDDRSHYYSECRGCFRRSDRSYGEYCSDCTALRLVDSPRRHEFVTYDDRRLLEYPSRRAIGWR